MGQLVLVPPPMKVQRSESGYGAGMTPVVFTPSPPIQDHVVVQAHVPIGKTVEMIIDPMFAYTGLLNFGRHQVGARASATGGYVHNWPTSLTVDELRCKFWDFNELQEFVADNLKGDVLAQYSDDNGRWQFVVCRSDDQLIWTTRVSQTKAYEFALDHRLLDLVTRWLKDECGIFDIIETRGYNGNYPFRVYIKDEDEALYFKMRWTGIDLESELDSGAPK